MATVRERSGRGRPRSRRREPAVSARSKVVGFLRELVVVLALVLVVQTFAFASFYVPTPSMEGNILVGDRIFVSKLHYGPRLPTTIGIPYTDWHVPGLNFTPVRIPGFSSVQRGDVVVFNWPPDDQPISKKEHYVKRAVGLPGDSLVLRDKVVYIDGAPLPTPPGSRQHWIVQLKPDLPAPWPKLRVLDVQVQPLSGRTELLVQDMDEETAATVRAWPEVAAIDPFVLPPTAVDEGLFPAGVPSNVHQYGPIYIPREGDEIPLNRDTWPVYQELLTRFEGHEAVLRADGRVDVDGEVVDTYTVGQDYYFMMGDNRDNSLDSRAWGFVPEDHIVGKALVAYFSWDSRNGRPRLGRTGHVIR